MNEIEAIKERHSVRSYTDRAIEGDVLEKLNRALSEINAESGLNIQLILNEPKAFDCRRAHYGKFSGVRNYFALIGKKDPDLDEKCGYYGEKLVILAQSLGLNTCWVALTYKKVPEVMNVKAGEKLAIVIALGYGTTNGIPHKSKKIEDEGTPDWFKKGVEAALLAPSAMNQQKFIFSLEGDKVAAKPGVGFYTKMDLGIAKCHFEIGSGKDSSVWL